VAVLGAQRRADHVMAEPRQLGAQRRGAEQLESQPVLGDVARMAFELGRLAVGAGELQVAAGFELDILAEPLVELVPERPCAPCERQLGEVAPCWRTPPKLTPLAPAPHSAFSSSATVSPASRNATAAAQPAMPPPTIATSTRKRSVMRRSRRRSESA
jgi:hypothetical protein